MQLKLPNRVLFKISRTPTNVFLFFYCNYFTIYSFQSSIYGTLIIPIMSARLKLFGCGKLNHSFHYVVSTLLHIHLCHYSNGQTMNSVHISPLKEYYEIVGESRPLSAFFPNMLIVLQKCISNHETKQSSKFQSDPSPNCFTIDV